MLSWRSPYFVFGHRTRWPLTAYRTATVSLIRFAVLLLLKEKFWAPSPVDDETLYSGSTFERSADGKSFKTIWHEASREDASGPLHAGKKRGFERGGVQNSFSSRLNAVIFGNLNTEVLLNFIAKSIFCRRSSISLN